MGKHTGFAEFDDAELTGQVRGGSNGLNALATIESPRVVVRERGQPTHTHPQPGVGREIVSSDPERSVDH